MYTWYRSKAMLMSIAMLTVCVWQPLMKLETIFHTSTKGDQMQKQL